ncbi:MAG: hypothetical protein RIR96_551 [Bacteroidota bacterium]
MDVFSYFVADFTHSLHPDLKIMLMRRLNSFLILFLALSFSSKQTKAQYYFFDDQFYDNPVVFELGGNIGTMNCLTDLGGNQGIGKKFVKDLNYGKQTLCGGISFSASFKNAITARLEANFGKVTADDAVLSSVPESDIARRRFNRNLNFQSKITEFSLVTEFHPFFLFVDWSLKDQDPPRFSPYVAGGIGFYSFNPQAKIENRLIDLQPLSTEGQGLKEYPDKQPYKLKQFNFPVGGGLRYELSPLITLRAELLYRILTTDYLDDVSGNYIDPEKYALNGFTGVRLANALALNNREINGQDTKPGGKRGSPLQNDGYFTFQFKVSLSLRERIK